MKKSSAGWLAIAVGIVASCCCVLIAITLAFVFFGVPRIDTVIGKISATRTPSVQVVATPIAIPYNVVVPTPTASAVKRSIGYATQFNLITYPVAGNSLKEISRSLDANALGDPHEASGKYYARTEWSIHADWEWMGSVRGCELDRGQVSAIITMTLPVLTTPVTPDVRTRWDTFVANTIVHESQHVRLVYDGLRTYQRDLDNLPAATTCAALERQLSALHLKEFGMIDRASVDYDAQTKHGETQGAVFP
jgi:predicted secreted Zn-dependent protease